jgi:hypothetical protein
MVYMGLEIFQESLYPIWSVCITIRCDRSRLVRPQTPHNLLQTDEPLGHRDSCDVKASGSSIPRFIYFVHGYGNIAQTL